MDLAQLKLDLVEHILVASDAHFLNRLRSLFQNKEAGAAITDKELEDLMASADAFGNTAYGTEEPDIDHLVLKEPNPNYKPWKPGM